MSHAVTRGSGYLEKILAKKRLQAANKLIPPMLRNGKILDIGCGSYPYFLLNIPFRKKYGIDPFVTISKTKDVTLKRLDVEENLRLQFKSNEFTVVTMLAVFEHIERTRLPGLVGEIRRVLKPGGRFILTTPCLWTDKLLRIMAKLNLVSPEEVAEHTGGFTHAQLRHYLMSGGFKNRKIRTGHFEAWLNNWAYAEKDD